MGGFFSSISTEIASALSISIVNRKHQTDRSATFVQLTVLVLKKSEDVQQVSMHVAWAAQSVPTGLVKFIKTS